MAIAQLNLTDQTRELISPKLAISTYFQWRSSDKFTQGVRPGPSLQSRWEEQTGIYTKPVERLTPQHTKLLKNLKMGHLAVSMHILDCYILSTSGGFLKKNPRPYKDVPTLIMYSRSHNKEQTEDTSILKVVDDRDDYREDVLPHNDNRKVGVLFKGLGGIAVPPEYVNTQLLLPPYHHSHGWRRKGTDFPEYKRGLHLGERWDDSLYDTFELDSGIFESERNKAMGVTAIAAAVVIGIADKIQRGS